MAEDRLVRQTKVLNVTRPAWTLNLRAMGPTAGLGERRISKIPLQK